MAEGGEVDIPLRPVDPEEPDATEEGGNTHHDDEDGEHWFQHHRSPGGGCSLHHETSDHQNPGFEPDEGEDESDTAPLISERANPTTFLNQVFSRPDLTKFDYGVVDLGVWVSLSRANATKYFIREDGTVTNERGRKAKLPKTLSDALGPTRVHRIEETVATLERNRKEIRELRINLTL